MSDYTTAVTKGLDILDAHFGGRSWVKDIDLDNLDLGSCGVCVLGQLFGDYSEGLEELGLSGGHPYGFDTSGRFSELTAAWKEALGENKVLVEQGDVYKDTYGYAVRVLQTHVLTVDGETSTVYVVESGTVKGGVFKRYSDTHPDIQLLKKSHFEKSGSYPTKVEPFKVKAGMFLANTKGEVFYAASDTEVRLVKDGGGVRYLSQIDQDGLGELTISTGAKFSDKLVK